MVAVDWDSCYVDGACIEACPVQLFQGYRTENDMPAIADYYINTLVNQIFRRYVEWDSYEPKVGMIPVAKPVVIQLFENISEDKIIEIATNVGRSAVKDIALFMKHRIDIDSFLE